MPLISVIIPTYNDGTSISNSIESVINQTFGNWELIIIDDGSDDGSESIIQNYFLDPRIKYYYQSNQGVSKARNFGSVKAKGEFLVFLDSDDLVKPNWLLEFYSAWLENKRHKVFQMGFELKHGNNTGIQDSIPEEGKYNPILSGTFMISKKCFYELGGYDPSLSFGENTELFIRYQKLNSQIILIPHSLLIYNQSSEGGSKNLQNMIDSILIILDKHQDSLHNNVKFLYNQILGVNYMRFRKYKEATHYLWEAFLLKPHKIDTIGRLMISLFPPLAKKLYPEKPNRTDKG